MESAVGGDLGITPQDLAAARQDGAVVFGAQPHGTGPDDLRALGRGDGLGIA